MPVKNPIIHSRKVKKEENKSLDVCARLHRLWRCLVKKLVLSLVPARRYVVSGFTEQEEYEEEDYDDTKL